MDFYTACRAGDTQKILQYLTAENINTVFTPIDETPLSCAISSHNPKAVSLLLERGADVDQDILQGFSSPLMFASARGEFDMITLLLQYGAKPDFQNIKGNTALHNAAELGWADIVLKLLEYKAQPNILNKNRDTPLHLASAHCNLSFSPRDHDYKLTLRYLLLSYDADKSAENLQGLTFLDKAKKKNWSMPVDWDAQLLNLYKKTELTKMLVSHSSVPTFLTTFSKNNESPPKTDKIIPSAKKLTLC